MKAVIYTRVSSDAQDIDLSISAQLRSLRDYAARHGYEIVREFVDEAESKSFLRSFIRRVEINKDEGVIQYKLPVPPNWSDRQSLAVLPIDNYGGEGGIRTPTPEGT